MFSRRSPSLAASSILGLWEGSPPNSKLLRLLPPPPPPLSRLLLSSRRRREVDRLAASSRSIA